MPRCIIIGAGVAGLSTAHALAARGWRTTLVDAEESGAASPCAGGLLAPLHPWRADEALGALIESSRPKYVDLFADMFADMGWRPDPGLSGSLYPDADNELPEARAWCARNGCALRALDADELGLAGVRADAGFLLPDVRHLDVGELLANLAGRLRALGATFVKGRATSLAGGAQVRLGGGVLGGDAVVVCAGAWTAKLLPPPLRTPIRPLRGQILALADLAADPKYAVLDDEFYLVPQGGGRCLVGSTVEDVGFDASTTAEAAERLLAFARRRVPAAENCTVAAHRAGLRPGAPLPVIGAHPDLPGVFVNSGHFRNGFAIAPAAAALTAELVCGETPHVDPAPFALAPPSMPPP